VTLLPLIAWSGGREQTEAEVGRFRRKTHEECFIANSIRIGVTVALSPNGTDQALPNLVDCVGLA